MNISEIYVSLLNNPHAPRVYRALRDYYHQAGMENESEAFTTLLMDNFGELPELKHDNNPLADKE